MKFATAVALAFTAGAVSFNATAKVSASDAARLGKVLTPVGAEAGANASGSIPAWSGGLTQAPDCYGGTGQRICDPFATDVPLYTITRDNRSQYRDRLSAGQYALLEKPNSSYKMKVYKTRRTFANPAFIYDATLKNATTAELGGNGEALSGAITGIPFPIPQNGHEVIWNHKLRFRGLAGVRTSAQFAVTSAGGHNQSTLREEALFAYNYPNVTPESLDNVMIYFLQIVTAPARLAGTITLVHETMDQVKEPRLAWQYNPGQRRLRRAPNVGYDNPGTAADGLRTNDQTDTFNGAMDRYDWKLIGKKEMLVPANSYTLHSDQYKYKDIVLARHLNQDLPRYELRRVWVVDATLRGGTSHIYKRRTFYVDEDGWQIRAVDIYDSRDQLWRVQESHTVMDYNRHFELVAAETVYDLQANRYLVQALNNEEPESVAEEYSRAHFDPANVQKQAIK